MELTKEELHQDYGYLLRGYITEPLKMGVDEKRVNDREYMVAFFMDCRSNTLNNMGCFQNAETTKQTKGHFEKCYDMIMLELSEKVA